MNNNKKTKIETGVEVNGPASCLMYLEVARAQGEVSEVAYRLLKKELEQTLRYMKTLDNPSKVPYYMFKESEK